MQGIGHVDEGMSSARAYLSNPVSVKFFDATSCAIEITLHEQRALWLREAIIAWPDACIRGEVWSVAESIDTGMRLLVKQTLPVANCWHIKVAIDLTSAHGHTLLDQFNIWLATWLWFLYWSLFGGTSFLYGGANLLKLEIVNDRLELVHDCLCCVCSCLLCILRNLAQIFLDLLQRQITLHRWCWYICCFEFH